MLLPTLLSDRKEMVIVIKVSVSGRMLVTVVVVTVTRCCVSVDREDVKGQARSSGSPTDKQARLI